MEGTLVTDSDSEPLVLDSGEAMELGFSSARFSGSLRRKNGIIYIWQISSKEPGKGYLSNLLKEMLNSGYTVQVPTPIGKMPEILAHKGFTRIFAYNPELEPYEVWVKEPDRETRVH